MIIFGPVIRDGGGTWRARYTVRRDDAEQEVTLRHHSKDIADATRALIREAANGVIEQAQ